MTNSTVGYVACHCKSANPQAAKQVLEDEISVESASEDIKSANTPLHRPPGRSRRRMQGPVIWSPHWLGHNVSLFRYAPVISVT